MEKWQIELHRLLEIFQQESTSSLRKINRFLVASGEPFGENFRKYFLKMSNLRLDTSFNIVLFEHENRMQITPSTSASTNNGSKIPDNANLSNTSHANPPNAPVMGNPLSVKTEHHIDDPVEIADSSDDEEVSEEPKMVKNSTEINALAQKIARDLEKRNNVTVSIEVVDSDDEEGGAEGSAALMINGASGDQTKSIESLKLNSDAGMTNDGTINTDMNDPNTLGFDVKSGFKLEMESPSETRELPLVAFDPTADNGDSDMENDETDAEPLTEQQQPSTSSGAKKSLEKSNVKRFECIKCAYTSRYRSVMKIHQLTHESAKPFKCTQCGYATQRKSNLEKHQRTHDRQKSMGVVQDPNSGLFKCTHCDQQFSKWRDLNHHLTLSHKDNQRLFNCSHCMRRFAQKTEKVKHEIRCQNRRYECFLCKTYAARTMTEIQIHMRTHTGAKPFECAICNKSFRQKGGLRRHLNSIHTQA